MGESFRIRPLDPERDRPLLGRLWEAALGSVWPLTPDALDLVKEGLVAERGDGGTFRGSRPGEADRAGPGVGMVAVDPAGSIPLLVVDPAYQRRGAGTGLLEAGMPLLGPDAGTIGCVGVAATARGAGLGRAAGQEHPGALAGEGPGDPADTTCWRRRICNRRGATRCPTVPNHVERR